MKAGLALLTFSVFSALSCTTQPTFDQRFNQLQPHMTTDQVKTLLGPPDLRELRPRNQDPNAGSGDPQGHFTASSFIETWHYRKDDPRVVVFEDNQVVSFSRDTPAQAPPASLEKGFAAPAVPLALGEECKRDSECQTGNCHFHHCSGKNNCQVKLGGLCGNDNDCCEGRCDFGNCRN